MADTQATPRQPIDHFFSVHAQRSDQWRELLAAARAWEGGRGNRATVENLLAGMVPTEEFHAFPGARLIAALRERLGADEAQGFASLARRLSNAIITRSYKHGTVESETPEESAEAVS